MHGFEVEIQTADDAVSLESLAIRAESVSAVASVSFVRSNGYATADIKISDRVTGKTTVRTIATPEGTDSATLLALRAVELLRGSLREFGPNANPPKDIVGAAPERATPAVTQWAAQEPTAAPAEPPQKPAEPRTPPPAKKKPAPVVAPIEPKFTRVESPAPRSSRSNEPLRRWSLAASAVWEALLPGSHFAYGGALTLGYRVTSRLQERLSLEAPWFGAQYNSLHSETKLHRASVHADTAYTVLDDPVFNLQLIAGLGLERITVFTHATSPAVLERPSAWVLSPRLGVGIAVNFTSQVFWQTNLFAAALLPETRLHHEDGRYSFTVGLPVLHAATGLGLRF